MPAGSTINWRLQQYDAVSRTWNNAVPSSSGTINPLAAGASATITSIPTGTYYGTLKLKVTIGLPSNYTIANTDHLWQRDLYCANANSIQYSDGDANSIQYSDGDEYAATDQHAATDEYAATDQHADGVEHADRFTHADDNADRLGHRNAHADRNVDDLMGAGKTSKSLCRGRFETCPGTRKLRNT